MTPDALRVFVRVGPETRGPYTLAQLKELGEVGVVGPATLASTAGDTTWRPLSEFPWTDEVFPPRREMAFGETQFIKLNRPDTPAVDHRDMIAFANAPLSPEAAARVEKAREAAPIRPMGPISQSAAAATTDPNDVLTIVRATTDAEAKLEKETPMAKPWTLHHDFKVCLALSVLATGIMLTLPLWYDFNDPLGFSWPILNMWIVLTNAVIVGIYFLSRGTRR